MPATPPHTKRPRRLRAVAVALALIGAVVALAGCGSSAVDPTLPTVSGPGPQTIFTAGTALLTDPSGTLSQLHRLGVDRVRMFLTWATIAPEATARHEPAFDATDPAAYPRASWAIFDTIVRDAKRDHLSLDAVLGPPVPRWAQGKADPKPLTEPYWEPDAAEFEQFVEAAGTRYSGHYTPPGAHAPLPRIDFWSIWNEPNAGTIGLAPQTLDGTKLEVSPRYYRALADAAWTGLARTGHGHDTTLIGELAPLGGTAPGEPGLYAVMTPLRFLRALYCVGSDYRPLTGHAAAIRGCPTNAAASGRFAAQNPVLFKATAFADHPYGQALPPDAPLPDAPDDTELAAIGHLYRALDHVEKLYGSSRRLDVYSTEFGYQTTPPDTQSGTISPARAATYLNWSEYLTWKDPRLVSYDQFLLADPPPLNNGKPYARYATGIETYAGAPKPGFAAFRMPIWLPRTTAPKGSELEVWGCVRPAKIVAAAKREPVAIQFQPSSGGAWRTVAQESTRTRYGYFDVAVRFPGSGSVRLRWSYPGGQVIASRTVAITLR